MPKWFLLTGIANLPIGADHSMEHFDVCFFAPEDVQKHVIPPGCILGYDCRRIVDFDNQKQFGRALRIVSPDVANGPDCRCLIRSVNDLEHANMPCFLFLNADDESDFTDISRISSIDGVWIEKAECLDNENVRVLTKNLLKQWKLQSRPGHAFYLVYDCSNGDLPEDLSVVSRKLQQLVK